MSEAIALGNVLRGPQIAKTRSLLRRLVAFFSYMQRSSGDRSTVAPYYGDFLSNSAKRPSGGAVKFFRLAKYLPESPRRFNLAYIGSNTLPVYWRELLWASKQRGVPLVYNQNGVYYPGWYGPGWGRKNTPFRTLIHEASFVFYQSAFCRDCCDFFLGRREGPSEVLHNAVDTELFHPVRREREDGPLNLLIAGNQYQDFPVLNALETLREVRRLGLDARLLIAGGLTWAGSESESIRQLQTWSKRNGVSGQVVLLGSYSQSELNSVHESADILIQAKYNDACPSGVVEALACGVPVVYSKSGGSPELVGDDAGVGVDVESQWDKMLVPDPVAMAAGVAKVAENLEAYSQAARERAVCRFDLKDWVRRHLEVFESLLGI